MTKQPAAPAPETETAPETEAIGIEQDVDRHHLILEIEVPHSDTDEQMDARVDGLAATAKKKLRAMRKQQA